MPNFGQKNTPLDSEVLLKLHLTFIEHCFYSTLLLSNIAFSKYYLKTICND